MSDVRILFVIPEGYKSEAECSEVMKEAYKACNENVANVSWVSCSAFSSTDLSKTDFVVFQEFAGKNFEALRSNESKCARIVGPWCISICLLEGRKIPNFPWPIYNVAMTNCVVSCSHLSKSKKNEIREKVQLMGGLYVDSFMTTNTHLITDSVRSEKYLQAAEKGTKLMLAGWVTAVWEASQNGNVVADEDQFKKYRCPPFHNLTVCSTGLPDIETRQRIAQQVVKNGGVFTGSLQLDKTDILIVYGTEGVLSAKYKAARQNDNISCLQLEWIYDSIEKGYALPTEQYVVKRGTSTPNKEGKMCPDFSMMSAIGDTTAYKSTIDETLVKKTGPKKISPPNKRKGSEGGYEKLVDCLDVKKAKMAGQYLDGCSVFVVGFEPEQREKLCKILNLSGATRYDNVSDRVTHIIVGDTSCPDLKVIKSKNLHACLVSVNWLLQCIENQRPVDEENFLIPLHDIGKDQFKSPLTRKGLSLLRSHKTMTSEEFENNDESKEQDEPELENDVMQQYMQNTKDDQETDTLALLLRDVDSDFVSKQNLPEESTQPSEDAQSGYSQDESSQQCFNLRGKKILLTNFPPEQAEVVKVQIENAMGTVLSKAYKGIPDFVVAPMFVKDSIQLSALEIVNELWIMESAKEEKLIPIVYYHRPLVLSDNKPLENCVVALSGYSAYERMFFKDLVENLGGVFQEQLARITSKKKGVLQSTHLVSVEAKGKKYEAALKWGIPVVEKEWLLECARLGHLAPEQTFLMGDSKAPVPRKVPTDSTVDSSNVDATNSATKTNMTHTSTPVHQQQPSHSNASSGFVPRILTPANQKEPLNIASKTAEKTPVNQRLFRNCRDDEFSPCSQVTPVHKIMEEVRKGSLLATPHTPQIPKTWYDVDTPDSPFGAGIQPHMSPKSKKEVLRYINRFPDFTPQTTARTRRLSTPLSEVKRRCWAKFLGGDSQSTCPSASFSHDQDAGVEAALSEKENERQSAGSSESVATGASTQSLLIKNKLLELENLVDSTNSSRRDSRGFCSTVPAHVGSSEGKQSQPFTVTWDYRDNSASQNIPPPNRVFIISGFENDIRQSIVEKIERLGAQVSDLSTYDPFCTHMICPKPARNEKNLSCMAAGKWILHVSYIDRSLEAGKFLDEEEFEFGNPKSRDNITMKFDKDSVQRCESMFWWRKEITRRGYKAFNDVRAIVVASRPDPINRVIEAGGGTIVDAKPPFKEAIHATHCLIEPRSVADFSLYNPLAQQGIYCVNTLYISDFLHRVNKDIRDLILPQFSEFY